MNVAQAYIDESGSDSGSPVLCLAGYVFHHDKAAAFSSEWAAMLRRFKLPAFHMVDCAHGAGDFAALGKQERVGAQTEAIRLITKRSAYGFAVTVNEAEYKEVFAPLTHGRWTAYYFCLTCCLTLVAHWARKTNFEGDVAYIFEAGHRDQGQANQIMRGLFANEALRKQFFYRSHTFGDKRQFPPLQAADVLAWQWFTHAKKKLTGAKRDRLDLVALVRPQDMMLRFDRERLEAAREFAITRDPSILEGLRE